MSRPRVLQIDLNASATTAFLNPFGEFGLLSFCGGAIPNVIHYLGSNDLASSLSPLNAKHGEPDLGLNESLIPVRGMEAIAKLPKSPVAAPAPDLRAGRWAERR